MDTKHVASLQTAAHSRVPVAAGVHRGETVVAAPSGAVASDVCLWYLFSVSGKVRNFSRCRVVSGELEKNTNILKGEWDFGLAGQSLVFSTGSGGWG